jgi:FixJ family two-component response regulator
MKEKALQILLVEDNAGQERALKAGAKAFLQKPVDNAELLAVIRQALGETEPLETAR